MALDPNINTREFDKFEEVNSKTHVRVTGEGLSGTFSLTGLRIAGLYSEIVVNDTTWTAVPATPLANRNALCLFNLSGVEVKLNYSDSVVGYVGIPLAPANQRFYDVTDQIIIYVKSSSGSATIGVEELS